MWIGAPALFVESLSGANEKDILKEQFRMINLAVARGRLGKVCRIEVKASLKE